MGLIIGSFKDSSSWLFWESIRNSGFFFRKYKKFWLDLKFRWLRFWWGWFFQTASGGWFFWGNIRNIGWVKSIKTFGWVKNLGSPGFGGLDCSIYNYSGHYYSPQKIITGFRWFVIRLTLFLTSEPLQYFLNFLTNTFRLSYDISLILFCNVLSFCEKSVKRLLENHIKTKS